MSTIFNILCKLLSRIFIGILILIGISIAIDFVIFLIVLSILGS